MLSLTRKSEYALIALCHLAREGGKIVSAREIADAYGVPLPLLMNVLKALHQGGLIDSVRGAHGGYQLAMQADEITLGDLIEAVEGPLRLVRCVATPTVERDVCELEAHCRIKNPLNRVHERLVSFLDTVRLSEIAFDGRSGHGIGIKKEAGDARRSLGILTHEIHLSR